MPNQKKIDIVSELKTKLEKTKSLVFSDYRGLTVAQIQDLKKKVKKEKGEYVVAKNTLMLKALEQAGLPTPDISLLEGPTATLFSYEDEIGPLKAMVTFAKTSGIPILKLGILDKSILSKTEVESLSKLPSKNVLYAQVVGALTAPSYGLVNVLQGNIRKLVYVIDSIKNRQQN